MGFNEYEPGSTFPGVIGRTTDESSPAWPQPRAGDAGGAERAGDRAGRHRLRPPGLLRQPDRDAEPRRAGGGRPALQQHAHDGAVLAVPLVHHHRAQPPLERHGLDHRAGHRLPRLRRADPVRERHAVGDAAPARLQHLHGRQVAPDAVRAGVGRRAVRPLAAGPRLRPLLRLPRRRHQPVVSRPGLRQPPGRAAGESRGGLPPERRPGRQGDRLHRRRQAGRPGQAVLPALLHRRDARPAPRPEGVGGPVPGHSSTTAGTPTASGSSPGRRSWASSRPAPSCPGTTRTCPSGTRCRRRRAAGSTPG